MMKNTQDLFSIGELAQALGLTRRMILHYEECGIIRPDGRDGTTGNRYYTIDTLVKIRTIRILQNLGLSLGEIRGYFEGSFDLPPLIARLETLRDELDRHIEKLRERSNAAPPQVKLVRLPRQTVYRRVYATPMVSERSTLLRRTALEGMRLYGADLTQRMYLVESSMDCPDELAFCVSVPPESAGEFVTTLPEVPAITLFHHGPYEELPAAAHRLLDYARRHGFTPTGTLRRIYLEGPPQHRDPAKFITQVALPVAEEPEPELPVSSAK